MGSPLSYAAAAASNTLEEQLTRMFLQQLEKQKLAQQATRDSTVAELGRGNLDVSRGNLELRGKEFDASQQPKAPEPLKPMAVSGRIVDPSNGKVIYEPPTAPETPQRPVSVAPGGRIVDPTSGKVIFAAPNRPRDTPTVVIQTVDENGNAVRKIVPKTAGAEYAATPRQKLSVGQQEDLATMDTVQKLSGEATKLGDTIGWKGVGGLGQGTIGRLAMQHLGAGDPREEELRNFVGNIQGTIAKLRGGTAFSAQEKAMLDSYTPTINDSPKAIQAKLKSLGTFIAAKRESTMKFAGAGVAPHAAGGGGGTEKETPEQRLKRLLGGG